jgi:hypothetical protein
VDAVAQDHHRRQEDVQDHPVAETEEVGVAVEETVGVETRAREITEIMVVADEDAIKILMI